MHVWTDLTQVPADLGPSVVTIGNFDGVHRGHRAVLARLVDDARAAGALAVAVTFDPHPAQVHRPASAPALLTPVADRLEMLAASGLDAVLLVHYTLEFAEQSAEEFVRRYVVDGLRARTVVVGRDARFGRGNAGDLSTMVALGERFGFRVEVIEDYVGDDAAGDSPEPGAPARRWSSSWVRELLAAGDAAGAARILGRPHRLRGVVVHGDARGRELGFPTANLSPDAQGFVPADGVYAGRLVRPTLPADHPDHRLPAAISIGTNPTFDGAARRVEAYVLDRDDLDLYGEEVVLELVATLRPTLRFASVAELVVQMAADVEETRRALARDDVRLGTITRGC